MLSWTEYYINIAKAVAQKSRDPNTKVGTVIVDKENRVVSQGFNGFVAGCDESMMTYKKPMKYLTIIHSEMNAILFARRDLAGCRIYTTHFPCENCMKHIMQAGIREVYYEDLGIFHRADKSSKEAVRRLIKAVDGMTVENNMGISFTRDLEISEPLLPEEAEALKRYDQGQQYSVSRFIDGETTTYGYGKLESIGSWEFPLRPEFIKEDLCRKKQTND